jgi:hypothetical protein
MIKPTTLKFSLSRCSQNFIQRFSAIAIAIFLPLAIAFTHIPAALAFDAPELLPEKYSNVMDVFVFPSINEGFPLVLLEAQSNNLPTLISSNILTNNLYFYNNYVTNVCRAYLYNPNNYYLIHIDKKAGKDLHKEVTNFLIGLLNRTIFILIIMTLLFSEK